MIDQDTLARDAVFEICGRTYEFPRSLGMLRRAETAVGAVAPFAQRLDARACTVDEIARLYEALTREQTGAPTREDIARWVFATGLRHRELALYLFSLTLGAEELERVRKERGLVAQAPAAEEDEGRGPFAPTAAPTGPSSTASVSASDGPPPRPAPIRFTR